MKKTSTIILYSTVLMAFFFHVIKADAKQKRKYPLNLIDESKHTNFECTIYYTPKESGFDAAHGFVPTDTTTVTTVDNQTFTVQKNFLHQAGIEGCGKMKSGGQILNVQGKDANGNLTWAIVSQPVGRKANYPLTPKSSCAASKMQWLYGWYANIENGTIQQVFGNSKFQICDCGDDVNQDHLDLYWDFDNPKTGDPNRPEGTDYETQTKVTLYRTKQ